MGYLTFQHLVFLGYRESRRQTQGGKDTSLPVCFLVLELQRDRNSEVMDRLPFTPLMDIRGVIIVLLQVCVRLVFPLVRATQMCHRRVVGEPQTGTYAPIGMEEISVLQL